METRRLTNAASLGQTLSIIERIEFPNVLLPSGIYCLANASAFSEIEHIVCPDRALHIDPERDGLWMLQYDRRKRDFNGVRPEPTRVANKLCRRTWDWPAVRQQSPSTRPIEKPIDVGILRKAFEIATLQNGARTKSSGKSGNHLRHYAALRGVDLDSMKSI
jgi:hypothetical protein